MGKFLICFWLSYGESGYVFFLKDWGSREKIGKKSCRYMIIILSLFIFDILIFICGYF